jgi:hypothetical protein
MKPGAFMRYGSAGCINLYRRWDASTCTAPTMAQPVPSCPVAREASQRRTSVGRAPLAPLPMVTAATDGAGASNTSAAVVHSTGGRKYDTFFSENALESAEREEDGGGEGTMAACGSPATSVSVARLTRIARAIALM